MKNPSKFESKYDDEFIKAVLSEAIDNEEYNYDRVNIWNLLYQKPMETFTEHNWEYINDAIDVFIELNIQNGKYNQRALSLKKHFTPFYN